MKKTVLSLTLGAALGGFGDAVPVVSDATMEQPTGTREVTITYTLSDAPAVVTLDIQTNATDGTWASIGGENIQRVTGDVWKKVETGEHEIKWQPDISWPGHKIADGGARAVVTAWSVDNPPDYMVVDLSTTGGPGTERYYPAVEFLPGGILKNEDYRLGKIVMRKISAKGVTWQMGSAPSEYGYSANNEKLHEVTLSDNYYIGVFKVTQTQYALVQTSYADKDAPYYKGAMNPMEKVCYNEIRTSAARTTGNTSYDYPNEPYEKSFLGLLRTKTGLRFDLPSEAQWEFACRAGHGVGFWNDGSPICDPADSADGKSDPTSTPWPSTTSRTRPTRRRAPWGATSRATGGFTTCTESSSSCAWTCSPRTSPSSTAR